MSNIAQLVLAAATPDEVTLDPIRRDGDTVYYSSYNGTSEFFTQATMTASPASNRISTPQMSITTPIIRTVDGLETSLGIQSINISAKLNRRATAAERKNLRVLAMALIDAMIAEDLVDELKGFY